MSVAIISSVVFKFALPGEGRSCGPPLVLRESRQDASIFSRLGQGPSRSTAPPSCKAFPLRCLSVKHDAFDGFGRWYVFQRINGDFEVGLSPQQNDRGPTLCAGPLFQQLYVPIYPRSSSFRSSSSPESSSFPDRMHDWLALPKWLPLHLLVPQAGLSSSISKGKFANE